MGAWLRANPEWRARVVVATKVAGPLRSSFLGAGRLPEHGFRELWFGPKARAWRAAHLAGRFEGACARCGGINWYGLPEGAAAWASP